MFDSVAAVKAANKEAGQTWFSRGNMRFFNSKIESGMYGRRYFITSEKRDGDTYLGIPDGDRRYTIREALPNGHVETVGEFQAYATIGEAREAARELVKAA